MSAIDDTTGWLSADNFEGFIHFLNSAVSAVIPDGKIFFFDSAWYPPRVHPIDFNILFSLLLKSQNFLHIFSDSQFRGIVHNFQTSESFLIISFVNKFNLDFTMAREHILSSVL